MKTRYKLIIFMIIVWAGTFLFFATRINIKSFGEYGPTFFAEEGYNFEYKHGFPTPWLSRYYEIPANQIAEYKSSSSVAPIPPDNFMIYKDLSYPLLATQGFLALIAPLALLVGAKATKRIRKRST